MTANDSPQNVGTMEAGISPEVADYFGVSSPPPSTNQEQVNSNDKENKEVVADKTKENSSEEKSNDKPKSEGKSKETEDKKTTETKKQDGEDKKSEEKKSDDKNAQPTVYEVAGRKYEGIEKAIEAIKAIDGKNGQLVGQIREIKTAKLALEEEIKELKTKNSELVEWNLAWQKYHDGEGERPNDSNVNLEETINKTIEKRETSKQKSERLAQTQAELDEIIQEEDFDKVEPFFRELAEEYEGIPKVGPKKLYERARAEYKKSLNKDENGDDKEIEALVEERVKKILAKNEANKSAFPVSGGGSDKPQDDRKISPEVADYFTNR